MSPFKFSARTHSASDTPSPPCRHVEYGRMDFQVDAVEMHQETAKVSATFQVLSNWHIGAIQHSPIQRQLWVIHLKNTVCRTGKLHAHQVLMRVHPSQLSMTIFTSERFSHMLCDYPAHASFHAGDPSCCNTERNANVQLQAWACRAFVLLTSSDYSRSIFKISAVPHAKGTQRLHPFDKQISGQ